jgi:hypothetical protein
MARALRDFGDRGGEAVKVSAAFGFSLLMGLSVMAGAQINQAITVRGERIEAVIPLQGLERNEDAVQLAQRIRANQAAAARWRARLPATDTAGSRLNLLVNALQDEAIRDLGDGYHVAANTSGNFPDSKKTSIEKLLEQCEKIFASDTRFEQKVVTHISTPVAGATIHFREYAGSALGWSTYSDGQVLDIGGYRFRVSGQGIAPFEETVVIIDSPHRHRLAP